MRKMLMPAVAIAAASIPSALLAMPQAKDEQDPKAAIDALNRAWNDYKETSETKASERDVLVDDKLAKIDEFMTNAQASIDEHSRKLVAGGGGEETVVGDIKPTDPEVLAAFNNHMRTGDISAALTKTTDGEGGYLAPVEWDRSIVDKLKEVSVMRSHARVVTTTAAGFKKVVNDRNIGSGWVGETAARPATSTPTLGVITFATGELYANPAISQQLLDDAAINIEEWLAGEVETEFSRQEGIAFVSGDGVNKPKGILRYVEGGTLAAEHPLGAIKVVNSGAAATITGDGLLDLIGDLPAPFQAKAKLFMSGSALRAARKLKDGQGNYLWQPSYALGQPQTIDNKEVVRMDELPAVAADAIAALYGDMDGTYLVVDRIGVTVLRDPYTNKPFVHFYTTKRVGGGVHNPEPMRALKIAA